MLLFRFGCRCVGCFLGDDSVLCLVVGEVVG